MKIYFSTFTTGTQDIIRKLLKKRKARITLLLDGLVIYESNYNEREIRNFHFLNNTFVLLYSFKLCESTIKSIEKIISAVIKNKITLQKIKKNLPVHRRNFKIVTSFENRMISCNHDLLKKLETIILRADNLQLNIKKPDLEFWVLMRREGYGFFGIRITYPYRNKKKLEKGELRSEISYIMSVLSNPNPKDTILDPFAGYGSIPIERALSFPYHSIVAIEKNEYLVSKLKQKVKKIQKKIEVTYGDALNMKNIEDNSINKIITDPPWGIYKKTNIPLNEFYEKMLKEFWRVLKPQGLTILLISQIEVFEKILIIFQKHFTLIKKHHILVSGQKATIYELKKVK